jgi:uncharacterized LabA/DUF88 family protein
VSKNVAVFVDVANIFYAAKAAGVDIDYVTLLKSATAGRDFVRAYAYTGLDPDNENQRQFHSFLSRSGYKVVSKDIRKYGDGRIKANLDIELVVDMMRMAQHIDIAVIVSGDGDFAPAIRAVQQMGVRAEVISFRGNTSSDLIDVADVFTDITQIARVEKGARSGRRVAAEGDLSMTEVPDKETEGGTRRRRARRGERPDEHAERPEVAARPAADIGLPGNLIVLPGERLSRVGADGERDLDIDIDVEEPGEGEGIAALAPQAGDLDAEGRRRRRRRGGRGRGRGRQEGDAVAATGPDLSAGAGAGAGEPIIDDEEFLDEEIAPLPQHSTFGSVWDSQLGVTPAAPMAASTSRPSADEDEDFEDEPEIPEYLLAERRQQQRGRGRPMRPGQGGGGRRAGYQSAMDRERYGRPAGTTGGASGFGAGAQRMDRPRPPVSGGGGRPPMGGGRNNRPPQQARPSRPAYQEVQREREPERQSASSEPWSEVPADVQALLRAELARRQGSQQQSRAAEPTVTFREPAAEPPTEAIAPARGRTRSTRGAASPSEPAASSEQAAMPARRGRRPAAASASAASTSAAEASAPDAGEAAVAAPAPTRARRTRSAAAETGGSTASTPPEAAAAAEAAPRARRTTRSKATTAEGTTETAQSEAPAAPRRRTTRKAAAEPTAEG